MWSEQQDVAELSTERVNPEEALTQEPPPSPALFADPPRRFPPGLRQQNRMEGSGSMSVAAGIWRSSTLACAFCLCLLTAAQSRGQLGFSAPVNLSIKSHDFHTVLKWDVHNSSEETRFNVDFFGYGTSEWKPVCVNVSTHSCDLSNVFVISENHLGGYYARVKAVTALQESEFAYTSRFTFGQNATLGAPVVLLAADGRQLTVQVKYPALNSISESVLWNSLYYNVYCRHPNQTNPVCLELSPENPLYQGDFVEGTVCVSAEVELPSFNLIGKKSKEKCLRMPENNISDSAILTWLLPGECEEYTSQPNDLDDDEYEYGDYENEDSGNEIQLTIPSVKDPENTVAVQRRISPHSRNHTFQNTPTSKDSKYIYDLTAITAISTTLVIVLLLIVIPVVIYLQKCRKKFVLPKSLAHIIVSERPYNVMNSKREESSVCVVVKTEEVTSVPDDSHDFQDQEETLITSDTVDPGSTLTDGGSGGSSEHVNADLNDPYAAKINIDIMDQNSDSTDHIDQEVVSDQDSSHDLSKTHCDSIKLSCTADNWGYDKPHVPLDMFQVTVQRLS
ncbi:interferon gamma receptor 1-like [Mobula hypostoma]|uniref:interferon gamma receptor 1-like n=1 Tax=Mobula hypostoma TaxID=723540 RepID=UPI002FC2C8C8